FRRMTRGLCSTPAARWRCATARSWPVDELLGWHSAFQLPLPPAEGTEGGKEIGMLRHVIRSRILLACTVGAALLVGVATGAAQSPQERMQALETALQTQPNDVPKLVALGRLYAETGRIPDGLKLLEKAVAIAPHDPAARVWLGSVQTQMSRTTEDLGE